MVSQFWAYHRENAQNHGRTRRGDERNIQSERTNQIPIFNQSQNSRFIIPRNNQSEHENQIPIIHQSHNNCFPTPHNNQISTVHLSQNSHFTTPHNNQSDCDNQIPIIHQPQNSRFTTLPNNQSECDTQIPIIHQSQNILLTTRRNNQSERDNQIPIIHQSQNNLFTTPQSILQRSQYRTASLNNFPYVTVVDQQPYMNVVNTQPHIITPYHANSIQQQPHMSVVNQQPYAGPRKINHYRANSIQNSSPNGVAFQGFTRDFSNPPRPNFHNPKNYRFLPYGEGSSRMNNSFACPRLSVNLNRLNVTKDDVIPITTPSTRHIIKMPPIIYPSTNPPRLSITSPPSCGITQKKDSDPTHDKEPKSYEFDIRDTEAWKRKGKSFVSPDDCYEPVANQEKAVLIFKDEKNVIPSCSIIKTNETNEKDEENLDLSLHL
ncbi:unnamed protein product [Lathyrus sativus]|nr:unnamed protein product [Lathyrus sativus]